METPFNLPPPQKQTAAKEPITRNNILTIVWKNPYYFSAALAACAGLVALLIRPALLTDSQKHIQILSLLLFIVFVGLCTFLIRTWAKI